MRILDENNIENFLEDIEYENIESVKDILIDVKQNGDSAVRKYSYEFDKMEFDENSTFEISEEEIKNALNSIDEKTLDAIKKAIKNIQKFAKAQLKSIKELKIKEKGSIVGHKITPIESLLEMSGVIDGEIFVKEGEYRTKRRVGNDASGWVQVEGEDRTGIKLVIESR